MISILVPTRNRPLKLEKLVDSVDIDGEILIVPTFPGDVTQKVLENPKVKVFEMPQCHTVIEAFNFMASKAKYDIAPASDDIEFLPGSLMQASKDLHFTFNGEGVIGFVTNNMDSNDDAFVLVGKKFFDKHLNGILWNPEYYHFYGDTELGDYTKDIGKFKSCLFARIINHHPSCGEPADETHNFRRSEKLAHDKDIYDRQKMERKHCRSSL